MLLNLRLSIFMYLVIQFHFKSVEAHKTYHPLSMRAWKLSCREGGTNWTSFLLCHLPNRFCLLILLLQRLNVVNNINNMIESLNVSHVKKAIKILVLSSFTSLNLLALRKTFMRSDIKRNT